MPLAAWIEGMEYLLKALEDITRRRRTEVIIGGLRASWMDTVLDRQYAHLQSPIDAFYEPIGRGFLSLPIYSASPAYAPLILYGLSNAVLEYRMRYMGNYQRGVESSRSALLGYVTDLYNLANPYGLSALEAGPSLPSEGYLQAWERKSPDPTAPLRLLPQLML